MRSLLAILLLSGCASFDAPKQWTPGPDDWRPAFVLLTFKDDVSKDCVDGIPAGRSAGGCTRYESNALFTWANSFVRRASRMQMFCYAIHELRHGLLRDDHAFGDSSCGTEGVGP